MPAAKHLLLQLLPAAAASASTPKRQLLLLLMDCAVCKLCDEQSMGVDEVLQVLRHLPLPSSDKYQFSLLAAAYRDGE
jgi:hypothetical protein